MTDDHLRAPKLVVRDLDLALGHSGTRLGEETVGPVVQHHDQLLLTRGQDCRALVRGAWSGVIRGHRGSSYVIGIRVERLSTNAQTTAD